MKLFHRRVVAGALLTSMALLAPHLAFAQAERISLPAESGQTFDGPGGKIYYEVTGGGSGTPLIVVNGGPGFDHRYEHITTAWDQVGKNRKVVFYDQRGNGQSFALKSGQANTLADQIDDLEALRAHLGFDRFELLGHSWGGYLSMAYAARHPDRVAHLILVDSAAPKWSDIIFLFSQVFPEATERRAALAFSDEFGDKAAGDTAMREYFSMLFYSPEKRDAFLAVMPADAFHKEVNQTLNRDIARFDLNPEIRKFRFPTLVITGRYDMNVAPLIAYRMHQAIPGSRFVVFERSGHMPFYEEPDAFVRALEDFLAGK
jgi:proline iminopeptidase